VGDSSILANFTLETQPTRNPAKSHEERSRPGHPAAERLLHICTRIILEHISQLKDLGLPGNVKTLKDLILSNSENLLTSKVKRAFKCLNYLSTGAPAFQSKVLGP
jgi:hypothetical protein